jgi:hypothetical protein
VLGANHLRFARHWCDQSTAVISITRKCDILLKRLEQLFSDMKALGSALANKENILLFDSITSRNILNNPYNAFHPIHFSWNSKNDKPSVLYLLRVSMPIL